MAEDDQVRMKRLSLEHYARLMRLCRLVLTISVVPLLPGCAVFSRGFLAPGGPVAAAERHEFFFVFAVMLLVIGPVLLLTPLIAWHYRLSNTKSAFRPNWAFSWYLEGLIWIPPTIIVIVLAFFLVGNSVRLDPYRRVMPSLAPLQIQAVALDWKWLFIYPDQHIASVNQLILPVGTPVHFSLTSGTVMQSLLMPRLAGQIYAMSGMTTQLNVLISDAGTYWGENVQYNGDGFKNEKFQVLGVRPDDFSRWVKSVQNTRTVFDDKAYHDLSRQSVLPHPIAFGAVDPGIFTKIVKHAIEPGYVSQHQEAQPHG
ncbi:cytochrome ubiquinol oxidase subunit II [Acidisoma sp.]|uniref:cytochrome ubiquinol oxidase subunit II n=1 Tax=Acidisoma sp. TaxID=1872115 RepID=UPI003B00EA5B